MHRGNPAGSTPKASDPEGPGPSLPSPPLEIVVEPFRSTGPPAVTLRVPPGTTVRDLLRQLDRPAEGSAVLLEGRPVPLDEVILVSGRIVLIPTFSGG